MGDIIKREQQTITEADVMGYLQNFGYMANLNKDEVNQFVLICKAQNLNPIKREAYPVKYGNKYSIVTGYEVYIKRAEETGMLDGWNCKADYIDGRLVGATITIYRKDWKYPFTHSVLFKEYNKDAALWKTNPETMIKKVCTAQGFRLAFESALGGLPYTQDEQEATGMIPPGKTIDVTPEPDKKENKKQDKSPELTTLQRLLQDKGYRDW